MHSCTPKRIPPRHAMTKPATRLLRSRLLNALTFPHGTERYVELIDPLASRHDVRAEVTAVHRQTPRSVTLTLAPNENWAGARAGQFVGLTVEIDGRRETRPYSPVGLGAHPRRCARVHGLHPPRRTGVPSPARPRRARDDRAPRPGRRRVRAPRASPRARVAGERWQRHHARHGDAAHALRRGLRRRDRLPATTPARPSSPCTTQSWRTWSPTAPGLSVARGFTQASGGALEGRFRREHLDDRHRRPRRRGHLRLRPARADRRRALDVGRGRPARADRRDLHAPGVRLRPGVGRRAPSASPAAAARPTNSGLPLLEQAEDAGLAPGPRLPHGHLQHVLVPQDQRRGAQRAHGRDLDQGRRAHPDLRVRPRSATSRSALLSDSTEERHRCTAAPHPDRRAARGLRRGARRDPRASASPTSASATPTTSTR